MQLNKRMIPFYTLEIPSAYKMMLVKTQEISKK